ncbi:hypothetical protein TNCV_3770941 [Trichonephila clavipes]|nr:hypothetical protein TNCV_3770941 [Trichonephila clavipes]
MRILDDARSVLRVSEVLDTQSPEVHELMFRSDGLSGAKTPVLSSQARLTSELSDLSDDDNAENKTYESRILEGESSSDESDEEKRGNILNGKTILDHSLP